MEEEKVEQVVEETPEEVVQQEQTEEELTPAQLNFREVNNRAKQAEKERDELKKYIEDLQRKQQEIEQKAKPIPEEEEVNLAPDDLVEWRVFQKKIKKLEEQLNNQQQQSYQTTVESQVRQKFNDFDAVVNKNNIEALKEAYPELALSLSTNKDLYSQSVAVYTAIKKLGIHVEDVYSQDRAHAQNNATKPRPIASVAGQQGESPISKANAFSQGLTPELKKKLWEEMNEYAKKR